MQTTRSHHPLQWMQRSIRTLLTGQWLLRCPFKRAFEDVDLVTWHHAVAFKVSSVRFVEFDQVLNWWFSQKITDWPTFRWWAATRNYFSKYIAISVQTLLFRSSSATGFLKVVLVVTVEFMQAFARTKWNRKMFRHDHKALRSIRFGGVFQEKLWRMARIAAFSCVSRLRPMILVRFQSAVGRKVQWRALEIRPS